jgi:hypothetical protein
VPETYAMNETDLAEYCRKKGLYKEQIDAWRVPILIYLKNDMKSIIWQNKNIQNAGQNQLETGVCMNQLP